MEVRWQSGINSGKARILTVLDFECESMTASQLTAAYPVLQAITPAPFV